MEDQHLMFQAKARTKKWSVPGSSTENKVKPSSATRVLPLEPLTRSRTSPWMISASGGQSLLRSSSYVVLDLASAFLLRYIAVRYFPLVLGWLTACRAASWLGSRSCPMSAATRHSMTIYAWANDTAGFVHVQALPVPYFSWEHSHRRHHPQHLLDWARRGVRPKVQGGGPVVLLAVLQQPTWPSPRHRADAAGGLADLSRTQRIRLEPRRLCMPPQPERTNVLPEGEDPGLYLQRLDHGRILRTNGGFAWLLHVYGLPLLVVNPSLVVVTYLAAHAPRAPPLTTTWVSGTGSDGRWPPRTGTVALSWARSWSTT